MQSLRLIASRPIFVRTLTTSKQPPKSGRTPVGEFDDPNEKKEEPEVRRRIINPETGEIGGPQGKLLVVTC